MLLHLDWHVLHKLTNKPFNRDERKVTGCCFDSLSLQGNFVCPKRSNPTLLAYSSTPNMASRRINNSSKKEFYTWAKECMHNLHFTVKIERCMLFYMIKETSNFVHSNKMSNWTRSFMAKIPTNLNLNHTKSLVGRHKSHISCNGQCL